MLRYTSSNPLNVTREIVRIYRRQSAGDQGVHEVELLIWEGEGLEARKTKKDWLCVGAGGGMQSYKFA